MHPVSSPQCTKLIFCGFSDGGALFAMARKQKTGWAHRRDIRRRLMARREFCKCKHATSQNHHINHIQLQFSSPNQTEILYCRLSRLNCNLLVALLGCTKKNNERMLFKVLMVNFCFSCSKTMIGINPTRNKTVLLVSAKKRIWI